MPGIRNLKFLYWIQCTVFSCWYERYCTAHSHRWALIRAVDVSGPLSRGRCGTRVWLPLWLQPQRFLPPPNSSLTVRATATFNPCKPVLLFLHHIWATKDKANIAFRSRRAGSTPECSPRHGAPLRDLAQATRCIGGCHIITEKGRSPVTLTTYCLQSL